jgi:hypothetical protein
VADGSLQLSAGEVTADFDPTTGLLREVRRGGRAFALANGPRLAFARPPSAGAPEWRLLASGDNPAAELHTLAQPQLASLVELDIEGLRGVAYAALRMELSPDGRAWKTIFDGSRRAGDGGRYEFPPQQVAAVRITKLRDERGASLALKALRVGYAGTRFPQPVATPATITRDADPRNLPGSGAGGSAWIEVRGGASGLESLRWTMRGDGALQLDFSYALEGEMAFHGVTFDHPETAITKLTWLGEGPYRVWKNRLRGGSLGVHEIARNDPQPGESFGYPEFQGYFAGIRWARLDTSAGGLTVTSASPEIYLRVGTPRVSHPNTMADFPAGDLSFLHAIPGMGSKFKTAAESGPQGAWNRASGRYEGRLVFRFGP